MPNVKDAPTPNDNDLLLPLLENGVIRSKNSNRKRTSSASFISSIKVKLVMLSILLVAAGGIIGLYYQPPGLQAIFNLTGITPGGGSSVPIAVPASNFANSGEMHTPTPNEYVLALGRIMPFNDIITLAPPYGVGDARIETILIREGEYVDKGQVIATLDNRQQLTNAIERAQTNVAVQRAQLAQIKSLITTQFLESDAILIQEKAAYWVAESELVRGQALHEKGLIAQTEFDLLQATAEERRGSLAKAEANRSRFNGIEEGSQTDIQLAERNLDTAINELKLARSNLSMSEVVAPDSGQVLSINTRIGERPGTSGVATLGNTKSMQVELEVYQADIHKIQVGQTVSVSATALGSDPLFGQVIGVGLEVNRQKLVADDPAANTDARIVPVRVTLDSASSPRVANYTGLQVTGRIALNLIYD